MRGFPVTVLTLLAGFVGAAPAWSHAHLQSSIPANAAQVSRAPTALTLNFSEPALLSALKLSTAGKVIPLSPSHDGKASTQIVVPLPALKSGLYVVEWRAIARDDGHVTHGSFSFSVGGS